MERNPIYLAVISIEPYVAKEYKNFKSAKQVESLAIIKKVFKGMHITFSRNEYEMFNYSFLNVVESLPKPFIINEWSIEDVYEVYWDCKRSVTDTYTSENWDTWNDYKISDPNGELRTKSYHDPESAIKDLILFSKYQNWAEYESECAPPES